MSTYESRRKVALDEVMEDRLEDERFEELCNELVDVYYINNPGASMYMSAETIHSEKYDTFVKEVREYINKNKKKFPEKDLLRF